MNVFDYIDISRIKFLPPGSKTECLEKLVEASAPCLLNRQKFSESILRREELMTTGLGFELAFPHSKSDSAVDFFITIGISIAGIEWQAFDGRPVKMVFLIGGPVEQQDRYLRILAALSNLVKKEENRMELLGAVSPHEFYNIFNKLALIENQAV